LYFAKFKKIDFRIHPNSNHAYSLKKFPETEPDPHRSEFIFKATAKTAAAQHGKMPFLTIFCFLQECISGLADFPIFSG
jgi:hypothetical protein